MPVKKLFALLVFSILISCHPAKEGKIEYRSGVKQFYNDDTISFENVYLKNTSNSRVITFTVEKTLYNGENQIDYKTDYYRLSPGSEKLIGLTKQFNSEIAIGETNRQIIICKYKIVGGLYNR